MQLKKERRNHSDISDHSCNNVQIDTVEINQLFEEAVSYFNQSYENAVKEACDMFQKVIEKDPEFRTHDGGHGDNPYFYLGRYNEYCLGDWDTGIEFFTKSIELCPEDSASYECRGFCWLKTNQYKLALEDFRKAKKLKSKYDEGEWVPDLDDLIIELENRLDGGKPNNKYDGHFNGN